MVTVTRPSINGTVLWLEAADVASVSLEGDRVAAWRDSSGLHNDAIQNSDAVRPTLVSEATKVPVLHFGAMRHTFLGVPDAETLRFGTDDFTVAAVFGHNNQPFPEGSQGVHLGGWAFVVNKITQPSGPRIGWGLMGNWPNGEQSPVRTAVGCETTEAGGVVLTKDNGYADGALRLWVMHRDTAAGLVELRENGVVANSAKGGPYLDSVDNVGTAITIGGARLNPNNQNSAGFSLDGDVAAIVAVKGPISAVALGELEGYLLKRYELAPK